MPGSAATSGSTFSDSSQAPGRSGASHASHATPSTISATKQATTIRRRRDGDGSGMNDSGARQDDEADRAGEARRGAAGDGAAGKRAGRGDSSRSLASRLARLVRAMWRQARRLQLPQTAGSLTFLSLLAIAPMFSIVFRVTTASPMFGRLRDALQGFLMANLFPASISDTVLGLLNQFAAKANELSVIGLTVFLLTAFLALQTIEGTLNRIWLAEGRRPVAHRLALYWMLLTLGPLLLGASLVFHGVVATSWLRGAELNEVRNVWYFVLPWTTAVAGLTLLYRLLPSAWVRWRDAFAGAMLAAFLFEFLRTMLGLYVTGLPTYTIVYGAFAALPLFLLWVFLGWLSVLLGALLAANLRFWSSPGEPHLERTPADRFGDAHAVLDAMREALGGDPYAAMPVERIERALDGDTGRALEAATLLTRLGYIVRFVQFGVPPPGDGEASAMARRGRLGRLLRSRRRPHAGEDTVWAERWAWADDPRRMSERALFEAVWTDGRSAVEGPAGRRATGRDAAGRVHERDAAEDAAIPRAIDRPLVGTVEARGVG